jgi:8-amino-7-oxononanoate synthase
MIPALEAALSERDAAGLYRRRRIVDGSVKVFCSNDYLGLTTHPEVTAAFIDAARDHGTGAGAAHLVSGHHRLHHELEEALAAYTGRERALLFSTGYMANLGIGTALCGRGTTVFADRLNHASLLDAARGSGARLKRFAHADAGALARALDGHDGPALVMTDGVFSMDGDLAPLPELVATCEAHGVPLVVDDAHGLGVLGATGRGTLEHFGLGQADVPVLMGTLGKAFGVFGAFVAGPDAVVETLIQHARTYIYTTALPPAVAAASAAALRVSDNEPWRRERLAAMVARFRTGIGGHAHPGSALTPIQPVVVGDPHRAVELAGQLERRGYRVTPIRPPTVPEGTARLRVTLSAAHDEHDVDGLASALLELLDA